LYEDLVAAVDEFGDARRGDRDAEFVVLDLRRDADTHNRSSGVMADQFNYED
jgi:hypothetical protein